MNTDTLSAKGGRQGVWMLYAAIAAIYLWFGVLKIFHASPAAPLIADTFSRLPAEPLVWLLGVWELAVGGLVLFRATRKAGLWLMLLHLPGTFLSYLSATDRCFAAPLVFTTEGEFVWKNLLFLGVGVFLLRAESRATK